jgi:PAS domain S-box-containing protein
MEDLGSRSSLGRGQPANPPGSAVVNLNREGLVTSCSRDAEAITGFPAEHLINSHFSAFFTAEDRDLGLPDQLLRDAATERHVETEGWRVRPDRSRYWARVVISASRGETGRLQGFEYEVRDDTKRREAQNEIEVVARRVEAKRIATELTEGAIRHLSSARMTLIGATETFAEDALFRKRIDAVVGELDQAIRSIRQVTFERAVEAATASPAGWAEPSVVAFDELDRYRRYAEHLQRALNSRVVIEQAKGMLANQHQCGVDQAFERLRRYARAHNRDIHEVARAVVERVLHL